MNSFAITIPFGFLSPLTLVNITPSTSIEPAIIQ